MRFKLASVAVAVCAFASLAEARPPLRNPSILNIGFVCRWNAHCMDKQQTAMKRALKYVRKKNPPNWKIQACNRNARRGAGTRVDWVGYHNCIRNPSIRPLPPPRRVTKRRR